jgi:hypothetical protein
MDFEVLPGPTVAELARTAVARAPAATLTCDSPAGHRAPAATVIMRAGPAGQPVLLPADGSAADRWLCAGPVPVTVSVPAAPPFSALRLHGTVHRGRAAGPARYDVALESAEFAGPVSVPVSLAAYRAAEPDPLWRQAPGILRHLGYGHPAELIACARAHGLREAEWVTPAGLDRFGLTLLVFTPDGISQARLSFPDGPVTSFSQVPTSLRAVLACRCQSAPDHRPPA